MICLLQQRETKLGSQKPNFGEEKKAIYQTNCAEVPKVSKGSSTGDSRQQTVDIAFARVQYETLALRCQ